LTLCEVLLLKFSRYHLTSQDITLTCKGPNITLMYKKISSKVLNSDEILYTYRLCK